MNNVFMTIMADDTSDMRLYLALCYRLQELNTKYLVYCAVTNEVSAERRATLRKIGFNLVNIDTIKPPQTTIDGAQSAEFVLASLPYSFLKLALYNLKQFDKIVYLDTDLFIIKNIDELFEYMNFSACVANINDDYSDYHCNDGLLIIEPNKVVYTDLLEALNNCSEYLDSGCERFLNYYLDGGHKPELFLPIWFNILTVHLDSCFPGANYSTAYSPGFNEANVKVLHFALDKSWLNDLKILDCWLANGGVRYTEKARIYASYINNCIDKFVNKYNITAFSKIV